MHFLRDIPIKRKLLWVTLTTCGAALALSLSGLFWFQSVNFRAAFVADLEALGAIIAQNSAAPLAFDDRRSAVEVLSALKVKPYITSATVFDPQGRVFAQFGTEATPNEAMRVESIGKVTFDQGYACLSLPVAGQESTTSWLQIRARFQDKYRELLSLYGIVLVVVLAGSLLIILIVSSAMQRIITGPIAALAAAARNVSEKNDYLSRAPETGRDEVGLLTRTFNQMLDQIQSRDERLRESQQRFEVAVQGSSDGLWDWDLVTNAVYFSPRWKSMLGFEDKELNNSFESFHSLVHPEDRKGVLAAVADYLNGKRPSYEVEFRALCRDGSYCWVLTRGAALRDEKGKPVRFAGSHTDITERKQAEAEIRLARAKFESLVNSIHGIVWEADPTSFRTLFISEQAESMLGFSTKAWLQAPDFWVKCIHPDDRSRIIAACTAGIATGMPFQLEYRVTTADGSIVWLNESVSVELEDGRPKRLRGVALDITERKRSAEQIARMQAELVDASRLAGMAEVATGVLHNVGNVLNSVNISTNLLVDQLNKSKTASLAKAVELLRAHKHDAGEFLTQDPRGRQLPAFFEAISEQLSREQTLLARETKGLQENIEHIKQIVAMQQSYARVCGALEKLDLHELVEDALRMSSTALARHQIELIRQYEPVPTVMIDRHKVIQILVNLISNAKHALEARATDRRLLLRITRGEHNRVRVEVTDNGLGIAQENLIRVFQHGFTTKKTGHGFGLHSGANAAREMGGLLNVRSDGLGTGATFILELPIDKDPERKTERPFGNAELHLSTTAA